MTLSLSGKRIVFTGFRDEVLKHKIEAAGGRVMSDVTSTTEILITEGDKATTSTKTKKATEMKIPILSIKSFVLKYLSGKPIKYLPPLFPKDKIKSSEYYIHDNGSRPFHVIFKNDKVAVYKKRQLTKTEYKSDAWFDIWDKLFYDVVVVKPIKYLKVFIGKDKSYRNKSFDGSSILVQLTQNAYMFIGQTVFTFKTTDTIIGFYSQVGNGDVMYPYAVGETNTYLLIEDTYMPNNMITNKDPYMQFYMHDRNDLNERKKQQLIKKHMTNFKIFDKKTIQDRYHLF